MKEKHILDSLTNSQKDWIVALMRVRSPNDEPTKEDSYTLEAIQDRLRGATNR